MQYNEELQAATKNIRYYAQQIVDLSRKQLDYDLTHFNMFDTSATRRIDLLGAISGAACEIELRCDQIDVWTGQSSEIKLSRTEEANV